MYKALNALLLIFAISGLGNEVAAEDGKRGKNFDILFVKDIAGYMENNPGLIMFNYDPQKGFTLGEKWNSQLFNLEYTLENFRDASFTYSASYTYPEDVTLDIQHVQLFYKTATNHGNVYLKEGGIGQNFVSLVVEVADTDETSLTCYVNVGGDIYNVID